MKPPERWQQVKEILYPALEMDRAEAMAEFQKIIDHRGVVAISALCPLAHLGVARAAVLEGDTPKGRKAYEDFFAFWKDADPDILLLEAKRSMKDAKWVTPPERLRSSMWARRILGMERPIIIKRPA